MLDTTDLGSYIPGYDEYLKEIENQEEYDYFDEYQEEMLRREYEKMERQIIDLEKVEMTFGESEQLENYVRKGNILIPVEMLEGE